MAGKEMLGNLHIIELLPKTFDLLFNKDFVPEFEPWSGIDGTTINLIFTSLNTYISG